VYQGPAHYSASMFLSTFVSLLLFVSVLFLLVPEP
jgi:hypothetical protein